MPKITDAEATKTRLVHAAWKVIATEGIEAATLRRVALEDGCTTGLITHYFSDKNELVTCAYRKVLDMMIADATEAIAAHDRVAEKLLAAIEAIEPTEPAVKDFTVVLMNFWAAAAYNPTFAQHCRDDYKRWRTLISDVVRAGIESGELREDTDIRMLTDILTLLSDGLSVGMTLTPTVYPAKHRQAIILRTLEPYLRS
jgi:TetR/AcrR family transcriptional repressor of bet genes